MAIYLSLKDVEFISHRLATETFTWNEPIPPFDTRFPGKLESCLDAPSQSFDGNELYPSIIEKASILFYLMIKNHPFQNGNKRVALTTLMAFLYRNKHWIKSDEQELYNFAKWVAGSPPSVRKSTMDGIREFLAENAVELKKAK